MLAATIPWVSCLGASVEVFWGRAASIGRATRAKIAARAREIFGGLGMSLIQGTPKSRCGSSLHPTKIRRQPTEQGSTAATLFGGLQATSPSKTGQRQPAFCASSVSQRIESLHRIERGGRSLRIGAKTLSEGSECSGLNLWRPRPYRPRPHVQRESGTITGAGVTPRFLGREAVLYPPVLS